MHLTEALSQPTRAPVVCDASGSHFFVGSSPSLKISSRLTCAVPSSITPSSAAFLPSVVVVAALAAPPLALRTKYTSHLRLRAYATAEEYPAGMAATTRPDFLRKPQNGAVSIVAHVIKTSDVVR